MLFNNQGNIRKKKVQSQDDFSLQKGCFLAQANVYLDWRQRHHKCDGIPKAWSRSVMVGTNWRKTIRTALKVADLGIFGSNSGALHTPQLFNHAIPRNPQWNQRLL